MSRSTRWMTAVLCAIALPAVAQAASDSKTMTINATVSARAKLTISPTTINFPDADPDVTNPIPATENAVSVNAKVRTSAAGAVSLTCLANGNLVSGTDSININNVTWTVASGTGFSAGTLSSSAAQTVAGWTGSGNRSGTLNFFLANNWAYTVGSYTQTVDYTLSAP